MVCQSLRCCLRFAFSLSVLSCGMLSTLSAFGQVRGILPPNVARQNGLDRVWATQIDVDRTRGRVADVTVQVSSTRKQTIYEITSEGRTSIVSELQLDPNGRPLGVDGAKKYAEDRVKEMKSKSKDPSAEFSIRRRDVPEITLYATTNLGAIHAIDGETGKTKWVTSLGKMDYPTTWAAANDNYVTMLSGSTILVLKAKDGELVWKRRSAGVPLTGPAVTDTHLFLPTVQGNMECHLLESVDETPWNYHATGLSFGPPVGDHDTVAWTTDRGKLVIAQADPRIVRYRIDTGLMFDCSPALAGKDKVVAVTMDGFVYCVDRYNGVIAWKISLGERCHITPFAIGDSVYILTAERNLYCLNLQNGLEKWPGGPAIGIRQLVSSSTEKLYCVGEVGRMLILDNKTGRLVAGVDTSELDLQVVNPLTDRIYLGTHEGTLQCLREIGARWPEVHGDREDSDATPEKAPATTKPRPRKVTDEDPFAPAAKGDADPFEAAPKKGAAKEDDDPFK